VVGTGGCGGDAHMTQRTHHFWGMLITDTAVTELPFDTSTKGVDGTLFGNDEAV
jgi:hypothetical protein